MRTPPPLLRDRTDADLPELGRLLLEQQPASGYPVRRLSDPASFVGRPSQFAAWVVEVDGQLAGHVALGEVPADTPFAGVWAEHHGIPLGRLALVSALFLGAGRTGLGLGGLLFDHAVAEAARHDRRPVLDTVDRASTALRMYERRGWRVIARAPADWLPDGRLTVAMVPPDPARPTGCV